MTLRPTSYSPPEHISVAEIGCVSVKSGSCGIHAHGSRVEVKPFSPGHTCAESNLNQKPVPDRWRSASTARLMGNCDCAILLDNQMALEPIPAMSHTTKDCLSLSCDRCQAPILRSSSAPSSYLPQEKVWPFRRRHP